MPEESLILDRVLARRYSRRQPRPPWSDTRLEQSGTRLRVDRKCRPLPRESFMGRADTTKSPRDRPFRIIPQLDDISKQRGGLTCNGKA